MTLSTSVIAETEFHQLLSQQSQESINFCHNRDRNLSTSAIADIEIYQLVVQQRQESINLQHSRDRNLSTSVMAETGIYQLRSQLLTGGYLASYPEGSLLDLLRNILNESMVTFCQLLADTAIQIPVKQGDNQSLWALIQESINFSHSKQKNSSDIGLKQVQT